MRVVLDSNVVVAAFATQGLCHSLFETCLAHHEIILSKDLLEEIEDKLRHKIEIPAPMVKEIVSFLRKQATVGVASELSSGLCRDPDDVKVLGLAVAAKAYCIVTGDNDLLVIKNFQDTVILTPRQFWETLQKGKPENF